VSVSTAGTFSPIAGVKGSMNGFDIVAATTEGGPARSTEVLAIATWRISSLTSPTGFCTLSPDENE
jgi:ABC-type sugar transport system permease subunit